MADLIPNGTAVKYWGQAKHGTLFGSLMTVVPESVKTKHQTYALEYESEDGTHKRLEQVLEASFTVVKVTTNE